MEDVMRRLFFTFKGRFWLISAWLLGPWHAPLLVSVVSRLTAGTTLGAYIAAHYNGIRSVLVVTFSLYFMLAFMMWAVGRCHSAHGASDERGETENQEVAGLSIKQILWWGLIGMVTIPALAAMSVLTNRANFVETFNHIFDLDPAMNSGFIWLISLSTVIMIPTMVIWLVWMWRAWSNTDYSG
jgi:hypothetical protein